MSKDTKKTKESADGTDSSAGARNTSPEPLAAMAQGDGAERDGLRTVPATEVIFPLGWVRRAALATVSGVAVFMSFPTFDVWPLAYVALVPLLLAVHDRTPRQAFGWGALMGFVTNFGGFNWISGLLGDFAHMDAWLAWSLCALVCAYQGLVFAIWVWCVRRFQRTDTTLPHWAIAAPTLLAIEFIFPMLFPWYLGNSQYLFTPAIQVAELFGVLAITLEVLVVNLVLFECLMWLGSRRLAPRPFPRRFVLASIVLVAAAMGWGSVRIGQIDEEMAQAESLRIGLVEGDIGIWEKEVLEKLDNNILIHQNLSAQLAADGVDLIVWPESSYQSPYIWGSTAQTDDLLFLELDSLFVPAFRDAALPAMRALEAGFGRHLHHLPGMQRPFHVAAAKAALTMGYKSIPSPYPSRCGEAYETHLKCPFKRVPPDEVTYFMPGHEPLSSDRRADRLAGTFPWNQLAIQRGFEVPLLFGGITIRAHDGVPTSYKDLLRASRQERELFNVALLVDEHGKVLGNYKKVFLLLFGESIPLAESIPWIYELIPEAGSFTAGTEPAVFDLHGHRIGLMICYEDILPAFSRKLAQMRPQVLINVTNDAWFGKTGEPFLHLALATIRAVESRVWLVRSTNTGVSAFIDANGRIVEQTSIYDAEVLKADVAMMSGEPTLYTRLGDVLGWASLWAFAVFVVLGSRRFNS